MGGDQSPLVPNCVKSLREVPSLNPSNSAVDRELSALLAYQVRIDNLFIIHQQHGKGVPSDYVVIEHGVHIRINKITVKEVGSEKTFTIDIPPGPNGRKLVRRSDGARLLLLARIDDQCVLAVE